MKLHDDTVCFMLVWNCISKSPLKEGSEQLCHVALDTFRSRTQEASTSLSLYHHCLPTARDIFSSSVPSKSRLLHILRWKDHWKSRTLVREITRILTTGEFCNTLTGLSLFGTWSPMMDDYHLLRETCNFLRSSVSCVHLHCSFTLWQCELSVLLLEVIVSNSEHKCGWRFEVKQHALGVAKMTAVIKKPVSFSWCNKAEVT